jgi:hypothetical protein
MGVSLTFQNRIGSRTRDSGYKSIKSDLVNCRFNGTSFELKELENVTSQIFLPSFPITSFNRSDLVTTFSNFNRLTFLTKQIGEVVGIVGFHSPSLQWSNISASCLSRDTFLQKKQKSIEFEKKFVQVCIIYLFGES